MRIPKNNADLDDNCPITQAINHGGGQTCDIAGVIRELAQAGFVIVQVGADPYGNGAMLEKLQPGEPFFVLRGQDKLAAAAVRHWANEGEKAGIPQAKVENARKCAWAMRDHRPLKMPD